MHVNRATNVVWHQAAVTAEHRNKRLNHRGFTIWFTGLSGSGKSTLAVATEAALFERGCLSYILDGDNVRHGLNSDLGFSKEDRVENIRRIAEVSKLFQDCGVITLTAFISPYRADRERARQICRDENFIEVFVDSPLEVCESRDPKGLYKKARRGEIPQFTGISDPYEAPENPEIHLHTDTALVDICVSQILDHLDLRGWIPLPVEEAGST